MTRKSHTTAGGFGGLGTSLAGGGYNYNNSLFNKGLLDQAQGLSNYKSTVMEKIFGKGYSNPINDKFLSEYGTRLQNGLVSPEVQKQMDSYINKAIDSGAFGTDGYMDKANNFGNELMGGKYKGLLDVANLGLGAFNSFNAYNMGKKMYGLQKDLFNHQRGMDVANYSAMANQYNTDRANQYSVGAALKGNTEAALAEADAKKRDAYIPTSLGR